MPMKWTAFWQAVGNGEGGGFGETDVLRGENDHTADDEERVFAGLDHAGEPVEGGVGV